MKGRRITAIIAAAIVTALCMSGCADSFDCTFYETTGNTNPFFVKTQGDCFYIPDYSEHPGIWEYDTKALTVTKVIDYEQVTDTALNIHNSGVPATNYGVIPAGFIMMSQEGAKNRDCYDGDISYSTVYYLNFAGEVKHTVRIKQYNENNTDIKNGEPLINEDTYAAFDDFSNFYAHKGYIYGYDYERRPIRLDPLTGTRQTVYDKSCSDYVGIYDNYIYVQGDDGIVRISESNLSVDKTISDTSSLATSSCQVCSDDIIIGYSSTDGQVVIKLGEYVKNVPEYIDDVTYADGSFYYISENSLYKTSDIEAKGEKTADGYSGIHNASEKWLILTNEDISEESMAVFDIEKQKILIFNK